MPPRCARPCAGAGSESLPGGGLGRFALRAQTNVAGSSVALTARQSRARRQHGRRRPDDRQRRAPVDSGDAGGRCARPDALRLDRPLPHPGRARVEPGPIASRRADRLRCRSATLGGEDRAARRQARTHRHRRQPAQRQHGADDRRVPGVRRRAQGQRGARPRRTPGSRSRHRSSSPTSTSKTASARSSPSAASRAPATSRSPSREPAPACWRLTRTLNGQATITANRGALAGLNLEQLLRRLERRPLSARGFPRRTHAVRKAERRAQDRTGNREHRSGADRRIGSPRSPSAARRRSRPATSTSRGPPPW